MDALIATRVMGWREDGLSEQVVYFDGKKPVSNGNFILTVDRWRPTEDISQAMRAVEKMMFTGDQQNDYGFSLTCEPYDGMYWGASLWNFEKPDSLAHADEETPALAICKAIALAIGEDA